MHSHYCLASSLITSPFPFQHLGRAALAAIQPASGISAWAAVMFLGAITSTWARSSEVAVPRARPALRCRIAVERGGTTGKPSTAFRRAGDVCDGIIAALAERLSRSGRFVVVEAGGPEQMEQAQALTKRSAKSGCLLQTRWAAF